VKRLRTSVQCRVIVDNDWGGDPDGLVALAHHLLSPTNDVVAVTSSLLNPMFGRGSTTAAAGAQMARDLIKLIDGPTPEVHAGSESEFTVGATSAAAEAIITHARNNVDLPLFLVCGGPLTNVAVALSNAPDIASRLTLVWIGGAIASNAPEYNRDTDAAAADMVFSVPDLPIWQFPLETYRKCAYSVRELEQDLAGSGRVGAWLWQQFLDLPLPEWVRLGGVWPLGDSPPVLITALSDESSSYRSIESGPGDRRIYTDVDVRLLFGDMLAKLRAHEAERQI
jgi:purine nucleosidase